MKLISASHKQKGFLDLGLGLGLLLLFGGTATVITPDTESQVNIPEIDAESTYEVTRYDADALK